MRGIVNAARQQAWNESCRVVTDEDRKSVHDAAGRLLGYCTGDRTIDVNRRLIANGEAPGALLR